MSVTLQELEFILEQGVEQFYNVYKIRTKKSAKLRTIEEPLPQLKEIQKTILQSYTECTQLHSNCMAQAGRSIADNAARHADSKFVLRVDVKSCYPSITDELINIGFHTIRNGDEVCISDDWLGYSSLLYCLYERRLPTGAPTSPFLCNVALYPLDVVLTKLAEEKGYKYTRYIDDLHFSTTSETRDWNLYKDVYQALFDMGLKPNLKKTKWQTNNSTDNLIVTGVRLGAPSKVPRDFRRTVRARLNNLAVKGQDIDAETRGCLAYIKSIDAEKYSSLLAYYERRRTHGLTLRECVSTQ